MKTILNIVLRYLGKKEASKDIIYHSILKNFESRGSGVIPDTIDDRDIYVSQFQKQDAELPKNHIVSLDHLEVLDQGSKGACVAHALAVVVAYLDYEETSAKSSAPTKSVTMSARWLYAMCKLFDGVPNQVGTYPRIGASILKKYGCIEENRWLPNDTNQSEEAYKTTKQIKDTLEAASVRKIKGFARVDAQVDAIKLALVNNKILTAAFKVSAWLSLPLPFSKLGTWHYVVIYGYETTDDNRTKLYIRNSWGTKWLSWIIGRWSNGSGYLILEDYIASNTITDIYAFTDIPANLLKWVQNRPYRFKKNFGIGNFGPEVRELQKMLNEDPNTTIALDGPGSKDMETSTFGPATRAALIKWQTINGITPTGYFGPLSLKKANERIPQTSLVDAIIMVESGGNDYAVGDKHLRNWAYGAMQIRLPAVMDVNRYLGIDHKPQDCLGNRALSIKIFNTYCMIYSENKTDEEKARLWNGGPGWRRNPQLTDGYVAKVKALLN